MRGTIIRQTMFAEFEKQIHASAESGEPLTIDRLTELYRELLKQYFGPDFALDDELSLECLRIPHFYHAFYVYKYATGMSAAIALADRVLAGGRKRIGRLSAISQRRLFQRSARSLACRRRRHGAARADRRGAKTLRRVGRGVGSAGVMLRIEGCLLAPRAGVDI